MFSAISSSEMFPSAISFQSIILVFLATAAIERGLVWGWGLSPPSNISFLYCRYINTVGIGPPIAHYQPTIVYEVGVVW